MEDPFKAEIQGIIYNVTRAFMAQMPKLKEKYMKKMETLEQDLINQNPTNSALVLEISTHYKRNLEMAISDLTSLILESMSRVVENTLLSISDDVKDLARCRTIKKHLKEILCKKPVYMALSILEEYSDGLTVVELAYKMQKSATTVKRYLKELLKNNYVEKVEGKPAKYVFKTAPWS